MECTKCKKKHKDGTYKCDNCAIDLCPECGDLTTSEVRVLQLKKRVMKFYCPKCTVGDTLQVWKDLLDTKDDVIKTKNDVIEAKEHHIETLKQGLEECKLKIGNMEEPSYASVVRLEQNMITNDKVPLLSITPLQNQNIELTKNTLLDAVKKNGLKIGIDKATSNKEGVMKVRCRTKNEMEKVVKIINSTLQDKFNVETEKLLKPRLKIVGIEKQYEVDELENDLYDQNFSDEEKGTSLQVKHIKQIKNKNTYTAYLEVNPDIYLKIMEGRKKLYIGWQSCKVYNDLGLNRCWKCCGYGHSGKKCTSANYYCQYCAENHSTGSCPNNQNKKCINCVVTNEKFHTNRNINHSAHEEDQCETYKEKKKYFIGKTNYPLGKFIE
jgi:hypothetical protein